jgi:hypothetical protein
MSIAHDEWMSPVNTTGSPDPPGWACRLYTGESDVSYKPFEGRR